MPVGVFDGLDSLEILRIANAGYRGRGITFVDEDIFRGLDTLRELDARPIRPSDDVLAPLTSLEDVERPRLHPVNLRTTMVDFTSGDSSRKRATLRREDPDGVSGN